MAKKRKHNFERARRPQQVEKRREDLLSAALKLFKQHGLDQVSLNDIAREVGVAKSNIYRYFASREHIYLVVLQRLAAEFEQRIYSRLDRLRGGGTIRKVVDALVDAYLASPEYGELITVVNSVLEQRLTPELVINFRTVFLERRKRLAVALSNALSLDDAEAMLPLTLHIFLHVPGLWTFCFPRSESRRLLQEETNKHLLIDFRSEMTQFLRWMLSGSGVSR
jgi:AcrR family transcriptional regulator